MSITFQKQINSSTHKTPKFQPLGENYIKLQMRSHLSNGFIHDSLDYW